MSVTHKSPKQSSPDELLQCPFCSAAIPKSAAFCGHCGARIPQPGHEIASPLPSEMAEDYRVTSLARKTPYSSLYTAVDVQQHMVVAINDLDLSHLDDSQRAQVSQAVSEEYELLHQQPVPDLMSLIGFRSSNDHLYTIAQQPNQGKTNTKKNTRYAQRILTLHDLLQTGIGLPKRQTAIGWVYRLSLALEQLHKREIIIGDIDPQMIMVDNPDYNATPSFMPSWLPDSQRDLFPQQSTNINTVPFYAPETSHGDFEPRSDIYSLGAILYLLLTGLTPDSPTVREQHPLPTPRELNSQIGSDLDSVVMRALSLDLSERFQSASEFSEDLVLLMVDPDSAATNRPRQTRHLDAVRPISKETSITSAPSDNKSGDDLSNALPPVESEEVTVSIVPLQARMARRYLSKIKTSKLDQETRRANEVRLKELAAEKQQSKEAEVEEGLAKRKQPTRARDEQTYPQVEDIPTTTIARDQLQAIGVESAQTETIHKPSTNTKTSSIKTTEPDVAEIPTQLVQLDSVSRHLLTQAQTKPIEQSDSSTPQQQPEAPAIDTPSASLSTEIKPEDLSIEQTTPAPVSPEAPTDPETPVTQSDAQPDSENSTSTEDVPTTQSDDTAPALNDSTPVPSVSVPTSDSQTSSHAPEATQIQDTQESATTADSTERQEGTVDTSNDSTSQSGKSFRGLKNRVTRPLTPRSKSTRALQVSDTQKPARSADKSESFFKRIQRFILGEAQYTTTAAALIETPMRVQPNQNYSIRLNVIGRNTVKNAKAGGLSGLHEGEKVHIEVRSAIYQNYAYIVQQADITIPASGFIAEVTMPMQPLTSGPSGRRERLHIFFMDEEHNALYEKPFVIEIFVSHLVQNGHEGHNVLSIPI